jgi:hypothetical protein
MATFMEAMQAARDGKRVRMKHHQSGWFKWIVGKFTEHGCLTSQDGGCPNISSMALDGEWEIEQPPPKKYSFLEAVALMEQGKTMRPVSVGHDDVRHTFEVRRHRSANRFFVVGSTTEMGMSLPEIQSEWEEAQP